MEFKGVGLLQFLIEFEGLFVLLSLAKNKIRGYFNNKKFWVSEVFENIFSAPLRWLHTTPKTCGRARISSSNSIGVSFGRGSLGCSVILLLMTSFHLITESWSPMSSNCLWTVLFWSLDCGFRLRRGSQIMCCRRPSTNRISSVSSHFFG